MRVLCQTDVVADFRKRIAHYENGSSGVPTVERIGGSNVINSCSMYILECLVACHTVSSSASWSRPIASSCVVVPHPDVHVWRSLRTHHG